MWAEPVTPAAPAKAPGQTHTEQMIHMPLRILPPPPGGCPVELTTSPGSLDDSPLLVSVAGEGRSWCSPTLHVQVKEREWKALVLETRVERELPWKKMLKKWLYIIVIEEDPGVLVDQDHKIDSFNKYPLRAYHKVRREKTLQARDECE